MSLSRPMLRRTVLSLCAGVIAATVMATPLRSARAAAEPSTVTVFAAASLKTALDAAAAAWSKRTGHATRIAYAGSSSLARQIESGAPADLFLSANTRWMDYLEDRRLLDTASRRDLFGNQLVLIAPKASEARATLSSASTLMEALGDGHLAVANTLAVPAGLYAKQALTKLGLWEQVELHLAQAQDVRAALALVARGEAPLGIVYATDANAEPRVQVIDAFPADSHDPIVYPGAVLSAAANAAAAAELLAFLSSGEGGQYFLDQGFTFVR
ncbi:MAG: molybdate ABC transporter substrate-binding protein [Alphaproteobacteria bacterium]|nr:molybdate ABC transporter substrate-binding protein [Alphaproteobacteria bacterium]